MKIRIILIGVFVFFVYSSYAQLSRGGGPLSYQSENFKFLNDTTEKDKDGKDKYSIEIDVTAKQEKEKAELIKSDCKTCDLPYYGKEIPLVIDFFAHAKHKETKDGGDLWLLKLKTKDWHGFQFIFEDFYLPDGAKLFFFNEKKDMQLGAFTSHNNRGDGRFVTQPLLGDKVYIEYYQPLDVKDEVSLKLGAVVCIFNDFFLRSGPFSQEGSGDCQRNTACGEADGWENEVKSVGMILEQSGNDYWGTCTGALINKEGGYSLTESPIFLTANHCYEHIDGGSVTYSNINDWVFLFGHQTTSCLDDGSSISSDLTRSVVGVANILSRDQGSNTSDYLLLELDCTVEDILSYGVCFAGWSRNGATPKTITIHHPHGDVKKFSYSLTQPITADGVNTGGPASMWEVIWSSGTTEPGSSGAPLFDENHQIIGQLVEGTSSCDIVWKDSVTVSEGPNTPDHFGKISVSWDEGNLENILGSGMSLGPYVPMPGIEQNDCVQVSINGDCRDTKTFSLGSVLELEDYAFAEFCRIFPGGPLLYDGIKSIRWYYDGNLLYNYSFKKTENCHVEDGCYWPGIAPGCFSLNSTGEHEIRLVAIPGQLTSYGFITKNPSSSISKTIHVIDCNEIETITTQSMLDDFEGYISNGVIRLWPQSGGYEISSGNTLAVHAYNNVNIHDGVRFKSGSSVTIKAFDCPNTDCDCNSLKKARLPEPSVENSIDWEINVYPNPVDDYTMVDLGNDFENVSEIQLIDSSGKIIFNKDCGQQPVVNIDMNDLTPGLYFVKVLTQDGVVVKKLIKK